MDFSLEVMLFRKPTRKFIFSRKKNSLLILEELLRLQAQEDKKQKTTLGEINDEHIKEIISDITGVPMVSITSNENKRLLHLDKKLGQME